jgi:hypothetical protein
VRGPVATLERYARDLESGMLTIAEAASAVLNVLSDAPDGASLWAGAPVALRGSVLAYLAAVGAANVPPAFYIGPGELDPARRAAQAARRQAVAAALLADAEPVTTEDIPEIATALAEFVADPKPYTIRFDPPLDLRAIAAEVRLLPAMLDAGGCLGLRPSGEVASFLWDEPQRLRTEGGERIRNLAYHQAALKYPGLALLVPRRPPDAVVCSYCGGSGRCGGLPDRLADSVICFCGGLGWLPRSLAEPGVTPDRGGSK